MTLGNKIVDKLTKLGRYEVHEELGRGAMGIVYKGLDPILNRYVALKVINPGLNKNDKAKEQIIARFYAEASAAGRLSHPSLITVFDIGEHKIEDNKILYIAMEYVRGNDLSQLIAQNLIKNIGEKQNIIVSAAEGLACAHQNGIIHRDVKPSNIRVGLEHQVKITDFGLAMLPDSSLTMDGTVIGTPQYISPEQAKGETAGPESDLFSLTVILYEMLTAKKPFYADTLTGILNNVITVEPTPPSKIVANLPIGVDRFIKKGLAKDPLQRHKNAYEYIHDLKEVFNDTAIDLSYKNHYSNRLANIKESKAIIKRFGLDFDHTMLKLQPLLESYPILAYHFDEDLLKSKASFVFKSLGFKVENIPATPFDTLAKELAKATAERRTILLHYRQKPKISSNEETPNIIDLLKEIKKRSSEIMMSKIIPVFISGSTPEKQKSVFQLLPPFGIRTAAFLDALDTVEANIKGLILTLMEFSESLGNNTNPDKETAKRNNEDAVTVELEYENLMKLAAKESSNKNFVKAIEIYTEAINVKPSPALFMERGDAFLQNKMFMQALKDYRKVYQIDWDTPEIDSKIAVCCLALAQEQAALDPKKASQWFNVGMKRLEIANEWIEKKISNSQKHGDIESNGLSFSIILKSLYEGKIDPEKIDNQKKDLSNLIEATLKKVGDAYNPELEIDPVLLISYAATMRKHGDLEKTEKILISLLPKHPKLAAPEINNLAIHYRRLGNVKHAFNLYKMILKEVVPDREIILRNCLIAGMKLALELRSRSEFDEAILIYQELLSYPLPKKEWFLCELAMTFFLKGEVDQAADSFKSAVKINKEILNTERIKNYQPLLKLLK